MWILSGAGLLLAVVTVLWVRMDFGICPPTDSEHHLFDAQLFSRTIHLGGLRGLWDLVRKSYVGWPPGSYLLLYGPLGWLFGMDGQLMRLYGLGLVPLLLWGTYHLGRELGDRRSGTLAAVLTIFCFGVSGQLRQVSIDLPATGAVLLAMLTLVRSRGMTRPLWTLAFGAACGLSLFTRVQSVFFLIGPAVGVAALALWDAPSWSARGRRLGWMVGAVALGLVVCSPWWWGRLPSLWGISTSHLDPSLVTPRGDPRFYQGLVYYTVAAGRLVGWPVMFIALSFVPLMLRRRTFARGSLASLILVPWVLGGMIGCTLGVHREPRYLLPAVPALVLMAVLGCRQLPRRGYNLITAALALLVVGPTLWFAAYPVRGNDFLSRQGVVEWGYVRPPANVRITAAAKLARAALVKASGDPAGSKTYLLFVQEGHVNYLPRLGAYMVPQLPDLIFSFSNNINLVNSAWQMGKRRRRKMFIMSETRLTLKMELVWSIKRGEYGNMSDIRLYRVPDKHIFRRKVIHRRHLQIAMTGAEKQQHAEHEAARARRKKAAARGKAGK